MIRVIIFLTQKEGEATLADESETVDGEVEKDESIHIRRDYWHR